jgi:hypothetical protein
MNEALRELTRRADIKGYRLVLATVMERGDGVLAGGLATAATPSPTTTRGRGGRRS